MSNRRKVKIYDKCVKEANSKDVSYNTALADLVFYHHYKWVKAMLVIKTICEVPEQDKISLIERLVPENLLLLCITIYLKLKVFQVITFLN